MAREWSCDKCNNTGVFRGAPLAPGFLPSYERCECLAPYKPAVAVATPDMTPEDMKKIYLAWDRVSRAVQRLVDNHQWATKAMLGEIEEARFEMSFLLGKCAVKVGKKAG